MFLPTTAPLFISKYTLLFQQKKLRLRESIFAWTLSPLGVHELTCPHFVFSLKLCSLMLQERCRIDSVFCILLNTEKLILQRLNTRKFALIFSHF